MVEQGRNREETGEDCKVHTTKGYEKTGEAHGHGRDSNGIPTCVSPELVCSAS
jgi:hypothetical protein